MKIYGLSSEEIAKAFRSGALTISVYGLGKIGLPLAAVFAENGAKVIGADINEALVEKINDGENPLPEEPGLSELVEKNVERGRLQATSNLKKAAQLSDVMVIIVPTLLDESNDPDLSAVISVCEELTRGLEKGDFVIQESTVPPGTTQNVIVPILGKSGLNIGEFGVAHCPERVSSGRAIKDITEAYPKVVGGVDELSTRTAAAFYKVINKKGVIPVSDATTAEAVKVFEGIYRDVNIALANQLALVCEELGIDAIEVFRVANTQPYSHLHMPGCGVGGHCIPVYPHFVIKTVRSDTSLLELSRRINDGMPQHVVGTLMKMLRSVGVEKPKVLILGLTFRGGVKELRYSPALKIIELLKSEGVEALAYDPLLEREEVEKYAKYVTPDAFDGDAILIAADHLEFKRINWSSLGKKMRNKIVVDGRQVVDVEALRHMGFRCTRVGMPCF